MIQFLKYVVKGHQISAVPETYNGNLITLLTTESSSKVMTLELVIEMWPLLPRTQYMQQPSSFTNSYGCPAETLWVSSWETSCFRICHLGTEFTSNGGIGGHIVLFPSVSLPPAQESEPGWWLVLFCRSPASRKLRDLYFRCLDSDFLSPGPLSCCLPGTGDGSFLRGPVLLFPTVCLCTASMTFLINSLLPTIHLNVLLNPILRRFSTEKKLKVLEQFGEGSACSRVTANRRLCPSITPCSF